jgi:hypothetical protein
MREFKLITGSKNGKAQVVEHLDTGETNKNGSPILMSRTHHIQMVNDEVGHNKAKNLWVNIKTGKECKPVN